MLFKKNSLLNLLLIGILIIIIRPNLFCGGFITFFDYYEKKEKIDALEYQNRRFNYQKRKIQPNFINLKRCYFRDYYNTKFNINIIPDTLSSDNSILEFSPDRIVEAYYMLRKK